MRAFFAITALMISHLVSYSQTPLLKIKPTSDFKMEADTSLKEWQHAKWLTLTKRDGAKNYLTQFKMMYSEKGLYCLFFCEDKQITSTKKKDFEDLYSEDVVEAFFWTEESFPVYFEYELSPYNFELPIMVPNNKGQFYGWRPWNYDGARKTNHATQIHSNKNWVAAFFIPYELLQPLGNVPPKPGTKWRCNFYRIDYDDKSSEWSWQATQKTFHENGKFGTVVFE
jgi:hypothetical protein